MKKLLTGFALSALAVVAHAGAMESLENFIRNAKTGRADFTQVITAPPKDGQAARTKTSSGTFEFQRPNRFRFEYRKPFEQSIVADGQTLWLYDVDLNQVTARKQAQVLGSTPAALISTAADLRALQSDFVLTPAPDRDGLSWVTATPKSKDNQVQTVQSVRIGFRDGTLAALDILDSFGQSSRMSFQSFQANVALDAASFQFMPPAGADVVRQ